MRGRGLSGRGTYQGGRAYWKRGACQREGLKAKLQGYLLKRGDNQRGGANQRRGAYWRRGACQREGLIAGEGNLPRRKDNKRGGAYQRGEACQGRGACQRVGLKDMIGMGCVREGLMSYEAIRKRVHQIGRFIREEGSLERGGAYQRRGPSKKWAYLREGSFGRGFIRDWPIREEGLNGALRLCVLLTYSTSIVIAADESNNSIACWDTRSTELQKTLNSGINKTGFLVAMESIAIQFWLSFCVTH